MSENPVIDSDGHVQEGDSPYLQYFPDALRDRGPNRFDGQHWSIEGVEVPPRRSYELSKKNFAEDERFAVARASGYSPQSQLDAMDVEGVDASVLFPTDGLILMGIDGVDPALTTAMATAYNSWLAEYCSVDPTRLFGAAMLDPRDVAGAIREAERAHSELGFAAAFLRPNPVNGLPWYDAAYEPLWSALEELQMPVCFHEGGAVLLPQVGPDRFQLHALWHTASHAMEQQLALIAVVLGGVAERHPTLRFAFLECGAGWLPYWMWRIEEHFENEPLEFTSFSLTPTEYIERQCFVSIDTDEETGISAIERLSNPRVVWGSDYPHYDGKYPQAVKTLAAIEGMTPDRFREVTYEAPSTLFGERVAGPALAHHEGRQS